MTRGATGRVWGRADGVEDGTREGGGGALSENPRGTPALLLLSRPAPLSRRRRRRHLLGLGLILLVGLVRVVAWSLTTPVWSPIDEVAHFGYVQSIGDAHTIPVIGRDLISDEVLASVKESPTTINREEPYRPTNQDGNWGALRHQYEATSAPTYYVLMALPYRVGHAFGLTAAVLAVRIATGLIGLVAAVLVWALARRVFPDRPSAWLVAPALLVATTSFAFGAVTNDPLGVVIALGAVLALARALEPGGRHLARRSALAGVVLGVGLASKATILVVAPVLLLLVLVWWFGTRPPWRHVAVLGGAAGAATVAMVLPWLLWNLGTYGALSGVAEVNKVLPPATASFSWGRLADEAAAARVGLFTNQLTRSGAYDVLWGVALIGFAGAGAIASWRTTRRETVALLACAAALPVAFVMSELTNYTIMGGAGAPVGRHLLPMLPIAMIGIGGAISVLASRVGPRAPLAAAGALVTLCFVLESRMVTDLVQRAYQRAVHDEALAPVIEQKRSDQVIPMAAFAVDAPCPVAALEVGFATAAPPTLAVRARRPDGSIEPAPLTTGTAERVSSSLPLYDAPAPDRTWYRLAHDVTGPFVVDLPAGALVNASDDDRSPNLALLPDGTAGDPTLTVSCRQPGGRLLAFTASYPIHHPAAITESMLVGAPRAEAGLAGVATLAAAVLAWRSRPRRNADPTR